MLALTSDLGAETNTWPCGAYFPMTPVRDIDMILALVIIRSQ